MLKRLLVWTRRQSPIHLADIPWVLVLLIPSFWVAYLIGEVYSAINSPANVVYHFWTPVIGIFGSFASFYAYLYAIRLTKLSTEQAKQTDKVLTSLQFLTQKAHAEIREANERAEAASRQLTVLTDALARRPISGLLAILDEVEAFLSDPHPDLALYVLTPIAPIGRIHLWNETLLQQKPKSMLEAQIEHIEQALMAKVRQVSVSQLVTLDEENLVQRFTQPVLAHFETSHADRVGKFLQTTHQRLMKELKEIPSMQHKTVSNLPFQMFIRQKTDTDLVALFIFLGTAQLQDTQVVKAMFVDADEELAQTFLSMFKALIGS